MRRRILVGIARQAGHPAGFAGRLMGVALNIGDRKDVTAAVDALSIPPEGVVADIGFGGGVGIALLLDRVDAAGRTELPFRPASLDGIITTHTIYFVSDLERAFAELADALKSSGEAVIGFGDPAAMEGFTPYGFRIRPVREVLEALERAELTLKKHQQIGQGSGRFHVLLAAPREAAGVQRL